MAAPVIVVCVLKSGGEYRPEHAARLYDQFLQHAPTDVGFLCLSDMAAEVNEVGVPAAPLTHDWPGWWSKIEALRMPGPCLYLDLDVTIVGDLEPLLDVARKTEFAMCRSFWVMDAGAVNSSVMAWRRDASVLYEQFRCAPNDLMQIYKTHDKWGDQSFLYDYWPGEPDLIQDMVPGAVVSFKRGALMGEDLSKLVVCVSHGAPRPWEVGGADAWLTTKLRPPR